MGLEELLLLNQKYKQCVRSGFCCKRNVCDYGTWDKEKDQCKHLGGSVAGEYYCKIKDQIQEKLPSAYKDYFGVGCGAGLNKDRIEILRSMEKRDNAVSIKF